MRINWWNVPGLLSMKLGAPLAVGVAAHYANGAILAIIYAGLAPSSGDPVGCEPSAT